MGNHNQEFYFIKVFLKDLLKNALKYLKSQKQTNKKSSSSME